MNEACPICESHNNTDYWGQVWMDEKSIVKLCADCESFFLYPTRIQEDQKLFDRSYDQYIAKREALVAGDVQDSFEDMVDISIRERLADLESYFPKNPSLLEVGAEKGGFLDLVSEKFKEVTGVDACPEYQKLLEKKGYTSYLYVEDLPIDQRFDRICFFSLLEHIIKPIPFLRQLRNHLKEEGIMIIEVPSAADPLISLYNLDAFKSFFFQAMHPYVYSRKSFDILSAKSGLQVVDVKYKQRYGLANHLKWLQEGLPGGNPIFEKVFSESTKKGYLSSLEKQGLTDTMYLFLKKEPREI